MAAMLVTVCRAHLWRVFTSVCDESKRVNDSDIVVQLE